MFGDKANRNRGEGRSIAKDFINTFKLITGEQKLSERTYGHIRKNLVRGARIIFASTEKFMDDDCLTKASSIAYTTIVSLIPTLAVGLTFFSIFGVGNQKEEIFARITKFMAENNLSRLNIDPYIDTLANIIDNAASIGGIGAVVLIFSATAVLRTMEHSLNTIWKVKKERSWVAKMIYYWATLTLGPIMLIAGTTAAAQISTAVTQSNYHAIEQSQEGRIWVTGNKAEITYTDTMPPKFYSIETEQFDFDNQLIFTYDFTNKTFSKEDFSFDTLEFKKSEFNDVLFLGNKGWVIGKNGIILKTSNGGKNWKIEKWGAFNFNNIVMADGVNGVIAADNGYLLKTDNGGATWNVESWQDLTVNIKSISIKGKTGIAVCDKSQIIRSIDGGKTWIPEKLENVRTKKRYINLNNVFMLDEKNGWIAADDGAILTTNDGFKTYDIKHFKGNKYTCALMLTPDEGYIGGENGILIYTNDAGATWQKNILHKGNINRLYRSGETIWAAGDSGLLMNKTGTGKWKGEKGTGFIIYALNFFGPFIFIWLSFLFMYALLPNTRVPFKPAAIGASITGAIWVGFLLSFIVYIKSFANGTFAVYGALAAFPIFLLLVYASAVIILYGAEVSYMVVYIEGYIKQKRVSKSMNDLSVYSGLRILFHVFSKFEKGKGATDPSEIQKLCERAGEMEYYSSLFKANNILMDAGNGMLAPATSSNILKMTDLIDLVHDASLSVPSNIPDDHLKKQMVKIFDEMNTSRKKIIGDITLEDIVRGKNL